MKVAALYLKIIGWTLLALLIADQGLRIYDAWSGSAIRDVLVELGSRAGLKKPYHPYLRYTSTPSFEGRIPHLEPKTLFYVKTNSAGFRTEEFFPPLPGRARVVLIGDSFVFGYNANQNATLAAVIKELANRDGLENVDVLSLGVPSYSGLRYAVLAKLYFEYLRPDIVIVALDQSDFEEDKQRKQEYTFDNLGCPSILKDAEEALRQPSTQQVAFDSVGTMVAVPEFDWRTRLRLISGFYNRFSKASHPPQGSFGKDWPEKRQRFLAKPPLRYADMLSAHGDDLSSVLPKAIRRDTIPYPLERAKNEYVTTRDSLACVKRQADVIGAAIYVSSYPYPWYVSTSEASGFLINMGASAPIDFMDNRVGTQLAAYYSAAIGVPHLDAYPVFEGHAEGMYGTFDPHFSEAGYRRYGEFLYGAVRERLRVVAAARSRS
jgi:hypothetical protein